MTPEKARARLIARREEILDGDINADARDTVELDQTSVGRLSRMDALQGQAMAQAARRRAEADLKRIETALARLDAGEWGRCTDCGDEIAPRRLDIDPAIALCRECAR